MRPLATIDNSGNCIDLHIFVDLFTIRKYQYYYRMYFPTIDF